MPRRPISNGCGSEVRILFVTSTRVGDAILSTGLLDHLIRRHPGARISIACGPAAASLFRAVPGLERLIVLDKMLFSLHWLRLWSLTAWRLWDVLVDLRNAPLTRAIPTRRSHRLGRAGSEEHRVARMSRVLDGSPPLAPTIWLDADDRDRAGRLIPDEPPVLALGPTANWIAKTWPGDRFADLAIRLTGPDGPLAGGRVALFGADHERPTVQGLIEALPADRRIDLIGRLDLTGVAACLQRCGLYVGNDSGLMHLAAAAGVPTLGLFGPTPDHLYAPWGDHATLVRPDVPWHALFPETFDHRRTGTLMGPLDVDRVEAAARALWARTRRAAA